MNKQKPYDRIIQDINDSLACIIQDVLIEMEYSLQDNIKVNTLDIGLFRSAQYHYLIRRNGVSITSKHICVFHHVSSNEVHYSLYP